MTIEIGNSNKNTEKKIFCLSVCLSDCIRGTQPLDCETVIGLWKSCYRVAWTFCKKCVQIWHLLMVLIILYFRLLYAIATEKQFNNFM